MKALNAACAGPSYRSDNPRITEMTDKKGVEIIVMTGRKADRIAAVELLKKPNL